MDNQFHTPSLGEEFDLSAAGETTKRLRDMNNLTDEGNSHEESYSGTISVNNSMGSIGTGGQKDPNEPIKPITPYALFFRDKATVIKQQNKNCSFQELNRIVSTMWEALDVVHKNAYMKKYELARSEYLRQMTIYQQQKTERHENASVLSSLQTKPAVFTIQCGNQSQVIAPKQATIPQQSLDVDNVVTSTRQETCEETTTNTSIGAVEAALNEAGAAQKCARDGCNKRAIISPDWEDEYCSNECVINHCRNVFSSWVPTNLTQSNE